jgi:hypothetical protein
MVWVTIGIALLLLLLLPQHHQYYTISFLSQ